MLVHSVYFWLKPETSEAQRADFRRAVESLKKIAAIDTAFIGSPAPIPKRPVVDDSYSLALTVLFKDLAAHDSYQVDPLHIAFVTTWKAHWSRVQIYDATSEP